MNERYRIPEHVLRAELDGEEVLLNPRTGVYHLVNWTGREVLSVIDHGGDVSEGVEAIARSSGEACDVVSHDVAEFIAALVARRLLEPIV